MAAPKPVAVTPAKAAAASPAKPPEKAAVLPTVTPAAKPAPAKPAPAAPAAPSGSPKPYLAAKPATSGEPPAGPRPFLKTPAGLAVIGALVLVLAASFFFYQQFSEQKAEALRKQAQAEQHAAAEAEAARKAEQQAKTEKEARRQAEQLNQPFFTGGFQLGCDRRGYIHPSILIPYIRKPSDSLGCWNRATIHKAEISSASLRHRGRRSKFMQHV